MVTCFHRCSPHGFSTSFEDPAHVLGSYSYECAKCEEDLSPLQIRHQNNAECSARETAAKHSPLYAKAGRPL